MSWPGNHRGFRAVCSLVVSSRLLQSWGAYATAPAGLTLTLKLSFNSVAGCVGAWVGIPVLDEFHSESRLSCLLPLPRRPRLVSGL
ncbi:hypothetical protein BO82DRAFT_859 [Aspergillus uvarum CBS 121591]|uniref:Uncharacterized protein n=1 Tax=Aspergillus uvarum CBS 121591 TaxID=1448315 RepID=A0A319CS14_9EURO|nr:hypothetical protein BO82DRAFT_859 [Aspergillus uvarum CBS 121591]PYH87021.1 hypothetical protein BO82DRAFT_859 [Aspergillus uvarum CBS 121591]